MALEEVKEKYAEFIEGLREKGIPSPEVLVPLLVIIAIVAVGYFVAPMLMAPATRGVSFSVKDQRGSPIAGASVTLVYANGTVFSEAITDSDGKADFEGVPAVGVTAAVSAPGYEAQEELALGTEEVQRVTLASTAAAAITPTSSFAVNVRNADGQPVDSAYVVVNFADGSTQGVLTDALGSGTLLIEEGKQPAAVVVETLGFQKVEQSLGADALSRGSVDITLQPTGEMTTPVDNPTVESSGTVVVEVESQGVPVRARVSLIDLTEEEFAFAQAGDDGRAALDGISFGMRFLIKAEASGYLTYVSPDYFTFTESSRPYRVSLTPRTAARAATISLTVTDANDAPLAGAEVNVFFQSTGKFLAKEFTDGDGKYSFDAERNVMFYATAYREGYLVGFADNLQAGSSRKIVLDEEVDGSTARVDVKVISGAGVPAANAVVSLYRAGGYFLGIPQFPTNAAGEASVSVPRQFQGSDYRLYGRAKLDEKAGQSDQVELTSETTEASLFVYVIAPPAEFTVTATDAVTGRPVSGAQVTLLVANNPVALNRTDSSGSAFFAAAADADFSFSVSAGGYLTYSSSVQRLASGQNQSVAVKLYPLAAGGIQASFLGLYNAKGLVREVSNGEYYQARFVVNIPIASTQSGFYVRLGNAPTAADEVAEIVGFDTSVAQIIYSGANYDPALECMSETLAGGEVPKWVLFQFPSGFAGTKEIALTIRVRREATPADAVEFAYRAYAFKNVPLFSPADVETANQLMAGGNRTLGVTDFCTAKTASARVPVTQSPLLCDETGSLCYKLYYDQAGVLGGDGFQVPLGTSFTLHYEILSDYQVNSIGIMSDYFRVTGSQASQTRLADYADLQPQLQVVSVSGQPGVKAAGTVALRATKAGSFAPITYSFNTASGAELPTVDHSLSVVGSNSFKVSVTPTQAGAGQRSRVTVTVLDRLNNPVPDARVVLYECEGTPFNSQEPEEMLGDGSTDNGEDGRYLFRINPVSTGWIGVKVSRSDSRTYDQCLVRVTAFDYLTVNPEYILIEGDSSQRLSQTITVSSQVPATSRVSATGSCFGAQRVIKVFPETFTLREGGSAQVMVRVLDNVTADLQCLVHFTATIAPNNIAEAEVPADVKVSCPNCVPAIPPEGVGFGTLPSKITLSVDPFNARDERSFDVNLLSEPVGCEIRGFRVDPYGQYQATAGANLWGCQSCMMGYSPSSFNCYSCMVQAQMAFQCQQCATQMYPASMYYCQGCTSYYGGMMGGAWSAGTYPGYGFGMQGGFGMQAGPFSMQAGFGTPSYGGFGYPSMMGGGAIAAPQGMPYQQPFMANPQMQYPYSYGYPTSYSYFDTVAYEDVVTADCSRTELVVTADYHGRQPVPGTGELVISFADGTRKRIPVEVIAGAAGVPGVPGMFPGVPSYVPSWYQYNYYCGIDSRYYEYQDIKLTGKPYSFSRSLKYNCPYSFPLTRASLRMETGQGDQQVCKVEGRVSGSGGSLDISCNFDEQFQENLPEGETVAYLDLDLASPQNPSARLQATIEIVLVKTRGAEENVQLAMRPSTSIDYLCNIATQTPAGETVPSESVQLTYQFPHSSTERSLILLDSEGRQSTMLDVGALRDAATQSFTIPSGAAGGMYSWRMIFRYGEQLLQYDCSFLVKRVESAPQTPSVTQPEREADRGSSFCDTPSLHPIRNVVVYNVPRGNAVVRTSGNHFSNKNSEAEVRVCIRSDEEPNDLSNVPIKVKFVPTSVNSVSAVSFDKDVRFSCTRVMIDNKRYYDCTSESKPVSAFADAISGATTLKTVVDASSLISRFYDYTPTGISEFQKRFYCQAWPLDRRAASTQSSYGLPSGSEPDSTVYGAGSAAGYADNNGIAPDPTCANGAVRFGVGASTASGSGGTISSRHPSGTCSDPVLGSYSCSAEGLSAVGTASSQEGGRKLSFAALSLAGGNYQWLANGRIRYAFPSSVTNVRANPILTDGTTVAGWVQVQTWLQSHNGEFGMAPACSLGGKRFKIKVALTVQGQSDDVIRWVGYANGRPSLVQNEADAITIIQEATPPCPTLGAPAGGEEEVECTVSRPQWVVSGGIAEWGPTSGDLVYTCRGAVYKAAAECDGASAACHTASATNFTDPNNKVFKLTVAQITPQVQTFVKITFWRTVGGGTYTRWVGQDGKLVKDRSSATKIMVFHGGPGGPAVPSLDAPYKARIVLVAEGESPSWTSGNTAPVELAFPARKDDIWKSNPEAVTSDSIGGMKYSATVVVYAQNGAELARVDRKPNEHGWVDIDDDETGCTDSTGDDLGGLQNWWQVWESGSINGKTYSVECRISKYWQDECHPINLWGDRYHGVNFQCRTLVEAI
ncbi:MAG: carboxypeptidase regulatory-like domain-containing protein [Candidatus Micrarchaeota archaeon]